MSSVEIVELSENDDDDDCILEGIIYEDKKRENNIQLKYKHIIAKNPLLNEFIETCLSCENSQGMKRVVNRTFLKMYFKADNKYKESPEFIKALKRAINLVKTDPRHKFSHIKDLCEIIRYGAFKKRVQLITLSNKVTGDKLTSCKRKSVIDRNSKKSKTEIIDLDSIDDETCMYMYNDEFNTTSEYINGEKENEECDRNSNADENKLLIPHKELDYNLDSSIQVNIKKIEEEIEICKRMISELDEQEVCDDSFNSPYIQSEKYKARIVLLHKELCKLTGEEAVKKSKVNLKVLEGHPEGPVRRLEKYLNKNVGNDGNPPFPSFRDVVKCVLKANEEDKLGWSKQQIVNEARSLFTHCGRALQKRRQRREWRDLLSKVKIEECDDDPADNDPELLARLEANKREAIKKETEILERYTSIQYAPPKKNAAVSKQSLDVGQLDSENDIETSSDESDCSKETPNVEPKLEMNTSSNDLPENDMNTDIQEQNADVSVIKIKKERESNIGQLLEELGENYTTTVEEIEDSFVVVEISDSSDEEY